MGPAGDWQPIAERAERLGAPVLAGADGWPLPVRGQDAERTAGGFLVRPPAGIVVGSGPACLTAHWHDESFSGQENVVLVGRAEPAGDGPGVRARRPGADRLEHHRLAAGEDGGLPGEAP